MDNADEEQSSGSIMSWSEEAGDWTVFKSV